MSSLHFIDSHTAGEPTRTIIDGAPDLGDGDMCARRQRLATEFDWLRRAVILEPRGCDWLVGALLQEPQDSANTAGVIFFNNVACLGMCGHGLIGVVETLRHLGRLQVGANRIETPVGIVEATISDDGQVAFDNVPSYRYRAGVEVTLDDGQRIRGDIAYGGNWFFLTPVEEIGLHRLDNHLKLAKAIRKALEGNRVTGEDGALIDHIELTGPPSNQEGADSRNFVLCPGGEYDRSPCGTGTSAKVACLADSGKLAEGQLWRQESIVGSIFQARFRKQDDRVVPTISGRAFLTLQGQLLIDEQDPFRHGISTNSIDERGRA